MLGPLGFNEIIFILVLGFLLLGPRQMALFSRTLGELMGRLYRATSDARRMFEEERRKLEDDMSEVTAPLRDAQKQLKSLRSNLRADVRQVEDEVRREKEDLERQHEELKEDWSRRRFLGDFDDGEASREDGGDGAKEGGSSQAPKAPEVRTPEGQMARGSLHDGAAEGGDDGPTAAETVGEAPSRDDRDPGEIEVGTNLSDKAVPS